jgi:APA family basic amino acid/polyamine antiporter
MPVTAILGIVISLGMMIGLPGATWLRLVIWLVVGLVIYFSYGRSHSRVQKGLPPVASE